MGVPCKVPSAFKNAGSCSFHDRAWHICFGRIYLWFATCSIAGPLTVNFSELGIGLTVCTPSEPSPSVVSSRHYLSSDPTDGHGDICFHLVHIAAAGRICPQTIPRPRGGLFWGLRVDAQSPPVSSVLLPSPNNIMSSELERSGYDLVEDWVH